jgi:Ca2+-binding EF-hand superfamily protein
MKKLHILALAMTAALASSFAIAQTATPGPGVKAASRIDANGDGVIDRTEAAKLPRLAEKFDQLDTNKDGKLSASERPQRMHGQRDGGKHGDRMQALDTDKDGRVSRAEANAGNAGFAQRFADMDVNKDGYLDRADRELRMTRERTAFFGGADANKDGRLSRDEFVVEQGARGAERREQFAKRAESAGKPLKARPAPTEAEQLQRAGKAFDRMDANKDGMVTKAEFDSAKPMHGGKRAHSRKP